MFPGTSFDLFGYALSLWNAMLLVGAVAGWLVFHPLARREPALTLPHLRFLVVVYLSAIAAQFFAYAFDASTALLPPAGGSPVRYYLNPLAGPKTLYGVIVLMPLSLALATWGSAISLARALDLWTRPMLAVLCFARVGCLLEGCCYGARSDGFGVSFAAGSSVYWGQRAAGELASGESGSLPVLPTQGLEAFALAGLGVLCHLLSRRGSLAEGRLFLVAAGGYSVFRFVAEFYRADLSRGIYGPLATSQWIALAVLVVIAATFLLRKRTRALEPVVAVAT